MDGASGVRFSIFDSAIAFEHREFYERIMAEVNNIFPVCNLGRCKAVEISTKEDELQQMNELMKKVETFGLQLKDTTKNLFDQFYQAKDGFYQSLYTITAYNTINLMDRSLLERTCDVRWWALEKSFGECIALWSEACRAGAPDKVTSKLPEALAAVLAGAAEGNVPDWAAGIPEARARDLRKLYDQIAFCCARLEDIKSSYTLYRDIVIADTAGNVIASANPRRRGAVLGLNVSQEAWFRNALLTRDATEYYAQDLSASQVEEQKSLVYGTALRARASHQGAAIGVMGVFFDFQAETSKILEDYLHKDAEGRIRDGWFAFFTNEKGVIIASSDDAAFEAGKPAHLPRSHRALGKGGRARSYIVVEGRDSGLFSAKTDGYLEYAGLGWTGHLIVPKSEIFEPISVDRQGMDVDALLASRIIPDINKETFLKILDDKERIKLVSLNGKVFASKLNANGKSLGPIFDQITQSGEFVTRRMQELLEEMALGELRQNLMALEAFARQAIDLVDRNLFERAADVRWWSTDHFFWKALMEPSPENFRVAAERLKVINAGYTMYRNLVLADGAGNLRAWSRAGAELEGVQAAEHAWFQKGMATDRASQYGVQDVGHSPIETTNATSLIYCGGVRRNGDREGDAVGVLGICFDWDTEAGKILATCLPQDRHGNSIDGSAAFYTNRASEVIETTDPERFPVGSPVALPAEHADLAKGQSTAGFASLKGKTYLMGTARTGGYREYAGLGWLAHVLRPVD